MSKTFRDMRRKFDRKRVRRAVLLTKREWMLR